MSYSKTNNDENRKYLSTAPPPPPPPSYPAEPIATGIPVVSSTNQLYPNIPPTSFQTDKPQRPWSTGLCGCFEDVSNCCITCWCPCITFGQISDIVDKGSSSCGVNGAIYTLIGMFTGCSCLYSCFYRSKLKKNFNIQGADDCCCDCLIHFCCEECALCQEYRELKNQGFDMSLGWHGNMEKHSGVVIAPAVQGGMDR